MEPAFPAFLTRRGVVAALILVATLVTMLVGADHANSQEAEITSDKSL